MHNWSRHYRKELEQAEAARHAGNEGKARVCARRAAGIVIGEYFRLAGMPAPGSSAYDRLRYLQNLPDMPADIRTVIQHFLERVTPEHDLPYEADLIAEARWLAETLIHKTDRSNDHV